MHSLCRSISVPVLLASVLLSPLTFTPSINAQELRAPGTQTVKEENRRAWPSPQSSVVNDQTGAGTQLINEPLMRIALSTNVGAATISTAGHRLKASGWDTAPQARDT